MKTDSSTPYTAEAVQVADPWNKKFQIQMNVSVDEHGQQGSEDHN